MKIITTLSFLSVLGTALLRGQAVNRIPDEELQVLKTAVDATLYSLSPNDMMFDNKSEIVPFLQGSAIRGSVRLKGKEEADAARAFTSAVEDWDGYIGMCFNPRHDLEIQTNGHIYNFLLCYQCKQMYLFKDGVEITELGASGTSKVLQTILASHHVPFNQTELAEEERELAREIQYRNARGDWLERMPVSMHELWTSFHDMMGVERARSALMKQFQDKTKRINALLEWYGTDREVWVSLTPPFSELVDSLLMDYSTSEIVVLLQTGNPTPNQVLGAASFFNSRMFTTKRSSEIALLPDSLKRRLLDAVKGMKDRFLINNSTKAFKLSGLSLD